MLSFKGSAEWRLFEWFNPSSSLKSPEGLRKLTMSKLPPRPTELRGEKGPKHPCFETAARMTVAGSHGQHPLLYPNIRWDQMDGWVRPWRWLWKIAKEGSWEEKKFQTGKFCPLSKPGHMQVSLSIDWELLKEGGPSVWSRGDHPSSQISPALGSSSHMWPQKGHLWLPAPSPYWCHGPCLLLMGHPQRPPLGNRTWLLC